jgi:hypothetical protein
MSPGDREQGACGRQPRGGGYEKKGTGADAKEAASQKAFEYRIRHKNLAIEKCRCAGCTWKRAEDNAAFRRIKFEDEKAA